MAKALTKEDLIYILSSIFHLSDKDNNAFIMEDDGLYVEDYHKDLKEHTDNDSIHIDSALKAILSKLSVNDDGELLFNSQQLAIGISDEQDNAITSKKGGLYVKDLDSTLTNHLKDSNVHLTVANKCTLETMSGIRYKNLYEIEIVNELPEEPQGQTVYLLSTELDDTVRTMHIYIMDKWYHLGINLDILSKYALVDKTVSKKDYDKAHQNHDNYEILQKFTETDDGILQYNGGKLMDMVLSSKPDNAIKLDGYTLYAPDYKQQIESMVVSSAFCKDNLFSGECKEAGVYELKGHIGNYSLLLIEFYYYPHDPDESAGDAKSVMVDTDSMEELYSKGIDYMLELGHGISVANSKIRIHDDKLEVNYYHNICIYKITGIKRGEVNNG